MSMLSMKLFTNESKRTKVKDNLYRAITVIGVFATEYSFFLLFSCCYMDGVVYVFVVCFVVLMCSDSFISQRVVLY